jgi:hypothetical protein
MSELTVDDLATVVRVVAKDKTISVKRDDKSEDSYYNHDSHVVVLSVQTVPKTLRDSILVLETCFKGIAIHECGHPLMDRSYSEMRVKVIEKAKSQNAMAIASNLVDDAAVNFRMMNRYGASVGSHLQLLLEWMGTSMMADMRKRVQDPDLAHAESRRGIQPKGVVFDKYGRVLPNAVTLVCALGNFSVSIRDAKDMIDMLDATQKRLIVEGIRILQEARTAIMWDTKATLYLKLYEILTKLADTQPQKQQQSGGASGGKGDGDGDSLGTAGDDTGDQVKGSVPVMVGGTMDVEGDEDSAEKAKEQAQEISGDVGDESAVQGSSVGFDPNARIRTPEPDYDEYMRIVRENQSRIKDILDRLKETIKSKLFIGKFKPQGRIMPHMIARCGVMTHPPKDIHMSLEMEEERMPTRWSILIDLSGSMDLEETKAVMVTLCEVASRYLLDSEFAIYIFGSGWLKVKSMYEQFDNIRARLGGVRGLGGTTMNPPLEGILKELQSLENHHHNKVLIVSDFWVGDESECDETMEAIQDLRNTEMVCLDFGGGSQHLAKKYKAVQISGIEELPDKFIEEYLKTK